MTVIYLILILNDVFFQQFGPILDVEIIFNERGSKVIMVNLYSIKYTLL